MDARLVITALLSLLAAGGAAARAELPEAEPRTLNDPVGGAAPRAAEVVVPKPGLRVRVRATGLGGRRVVGEILAVDEQTLSLGRPDRMEPIVIPRSAIREWEVSEGRETRARAGATVGAVVAGLGGLLFGTLLGGFANFECESSCHPAAPYAGGALGAALGAGAGAVVGRLVGSTMESESWQALPPRGPAVGLAPGRRGMAWASWSISF